VLLGASAVRGRRVPAKTESARRAPSLHSPCATTSAHWRPSLKSRLSKWRRAPPHAAWTSPPSTLRGMAPRGMVPEGAGRAEGTPGINIYRSIIDRLFMEVSSLQMEACAAACCLDLASFYLAWHGAAGHSTGGGRSGRRDSRYPLPLVSGYNLGAALNTSSLYIDRH